MKNIRKLCESVLSYNGYTLPISFSLGASFIFIPIFNKNNVSMRLLLPMSLIYVSSFIILSVLYSMYGESRKIKPVVVVVVGVISLFIQLFYTGSLVFASIISMLMALITFIFAYDCLERLIEFINNGFY